MAHLTVQCPECDDESQHVDLVSFRAECARCAHDLHCCHACTFYDRYADNECREFSADPISTKDRNNLCDYFRPAAIKAVADGSAQQSALDKLNAAFGVKTNVPPPDPKAALDALFRKKSAPDNEGT